MLQRLYVKNIALINEVDIEFDSKLNVLSGETGSGKSVILDSINFVLGSKADKNLIRYGESEAIVKAEFAVSNDSAAAEAMRELEIDCDGQIIITRRLAQDGRGNIKLNGNAVTVSMLKSVTSHLVDVHGQSEHFFLLNEANQLKVIDELCGKDVVKVKSELSDLIEKKRALKDIINSLGADEQQRERKLDLLSYQIKEIEAAELREDEFEELKAKSILIANAEKILNALNTVKSIFNDDGGCIDAVMCAQRQIASISNIGEEYGNLYSRIEGLAVEAGDICDGISDMADEVSFDEREAQYVEERLALIKGLRKKYGADEREIFIFLEEAKAEYDKLLNCTETVEKCNKELAEIDDKIFVLCKNLTELRTKCSSVLCQNVEYQLKTLNIPCAKFKVYFEEYDRCSANLNSINGSDNVSFMFSANKGEPLKPLNKVISGGEMSRFMLAIKTQLKSLNGISTYIFDEIDAGISGITARTVAEKFIDISADTQIIAVSHLPQICAASNSQYLIYKTESEGKTLSTVKRLSYEEKINEIIRLTGSIDSHASKEHAIELINQFNKSN